MPAVIRGLLAGKPRPRSSRTILGEPPFRRPPDGKLPAGRFQVNGYLGTNLPALE